jgi:regulator of sigma E protease
LAQGNGSKASAQVSGPVGVFVLLKDGSLLGYQFVLVIIAIISLTLAIMNVLPIPALDGGRLFVTLLYRIRNKPLTQKIEDRIHGTGFAVLMLLFVLITIVDVRRFW